MALLIGPMVAFLGVLATAYVLRTRARAQRSIYSTLRSEREARVRAARERTLAPPPAPAPPTAQAASQAGPATEGASTPETTMVMEKPPALDEAAQQAWAASANAPGAPPTEAVEPSAPAAADPDWAAGTASIEPLAAEPVAPPSPEPVAEPVWDPAPTPTAGAAEPVAIPAEEPQPTAIPESTAPVASSGGQPGWSVVEPSNAKDPAGGPGGSGGSTAAWEVVKRPEAVDPLETMRKAAQRDLMIKNVLGYIGLVGALVVILLGVVLMVATTR